MLEPTEKLTKRVTIRATPSDVRRLDAAAEVAGVTRSRVLREGGLQVAREILRDATETEPDGE